MRPQPLITTQKTPKHYGWPLKTSLLSFIANLLHFLKVLTRRLRENIPKNDSDFFVFFLLKDNLVHPFFKQNIFNNFLIKSKPNSMMMITITIIIINYLHSQMLYYIPIYI